jgi:hypothetical protein
MVENIPFLGREGFGGRIFGLTVLGGSGTVG